MDETNKTLNYTIRETLELNLSYMPFVKDGGLFIPTKEAFVLGDNVVVEVQLPGKKDSLKIEGKVVWITPKNALHHVASGIGIQFTGAQSKAIKSEIEASLDKSVDVGGYTYGITEAIDKVKK